MSKTKRIDRGRRGAGRGRDSGGGNPLRLIRPGRLAELLDVDRTTIFRWAKNGVLPPPIEMSDAVHGWTEAQLLQVFEERKREVGR